MPIITLYSLYHADYQQQQKRKMWEIISLWHRYDWYHIPVIMEIGNKRPNMKKATHT